MASNNRLHHTSLRGRVARLIHVPPFCERCDRPATLLPPRAREVIGGVEVPLAPVLRAVIGAAIRRRRRADSAKTLDYQTKPPRNL